MMDTEEKLAALTEIVARLVALYIGHITELNRVETLQREALELHEKLKRLKGL